MLTRILLLAAVIYLVYRFVWRKRPASPAPQESREVSQTDVLVQDPWCRTFIPRGQALEVQADGQTLHFCSPDCRDRFLQKERERTEEK